MTTIFNISNHPQIDGFTRKVQVIGPYIDFVKKEIVCPIDIIHYDSNGLPTDYIPTKRVAMITNNSKYVDVQGNRIDIQELNVPENAIPEFDFLFSFVSQKDTIGDIILEVIEFMILRNDQNGIFNDMNNFQ
ncbi:hypothetical protein ACWA1C_09200 [Flectobacillus roseus]